MKKILQLFGFIIFLFFVSTPSVFAITIRSEDQSTVSNTEHIEGSLFISGSEVRIEGTIDGDLYCAGQDVEVVGPVNGDIICAAQNLRIRSKVSGDIRAAAQNLSVSDSVGGNVTAFAQTLFVDKQATVAGEVGTGAQTLRIEGTVQKSVYGGAQKVYIDGIIGGDVQVSAEDISVLPNAHILGGLQYESDHTASVSETAIIDGKTTRTEPTMKRSNTQESGERRIFSSNRIKGMSYVGITLLTGIVLLLFAQKFLKRYSENIQNQPGTNVLRGLLFLISIPIIMLLLAVTIIGIPFVIVLALLLVPIYVIGRTLVTFAVGRLLLERLWEKKKESFGWSLGVGILALWAAQLLPVVGWFVSLLITLAGFGSLTHIIDELNAAKKK